MATKHHSAHSDSVGAATVAKRRVPRTKLSASSDSGEPAAASSGTRSSARRAKIIDVDNDAIARLAYSYWAARGYAGGSPEQDWLRAERELRSKALEPVSA